MTSELHAAMIGIAACAHSLDALYAELAELVGPDTLAEWEENRRGGRWAEVAGILDLSFDVDVDRWRPRLRTLSRAITAHKSSVKSAGRCRGRSA
jgi:hypothetical protein